MNRLSLLGVLLCASALPVAAIAREPAPAPATTTIESMTPAPVEPEVTVNLGAKPSPTGPLAPLPKIEFDLPEGLIPKVPLPAPQPIAETAPTVAKKLTPEEIARKIAPNFDVGRDYVRLTQCYGIADFMGAVTRIQVARPSATPQIVGVARTIGAMQEAMQPMVLAASTVRTEARFRRDYDAIARRGQAELATSKTPNATMTRRLATLDACRVDIARWRGGK